MRVFFLFTGSFSVFIHSFSSTGFFGHPPLPFHPPFFFFLIFSRFAPLFLLRPLLLCPRSFPSLCRLRFLRPPALFALFLSYALSLFLFPPLYSSPPSSAPHFFLSLFSSPPPFMPPFPLLRPSAFLPHVCSLCAFLLRLFPLCLFTYPYFHPAFPASLLRSTPIGFHSSGSFRFISSPARILFLLLHSFSTLPPSCFFALFPFCLFFFGQLSSPVPLRLSSLTRILPPLTGPHPFRPSFLFFFIFPLLLFPFSSSIPIPPSTSFLRRSPPHTVCPCRPPPFGLFYFL